MCSFVLQVSSLKCKIPKTFTGSRSEQRSLVGRTNSQHPVGESAKKRDTSSKSATNNRKNNENCQRSDERSDKMANMGALVERHRGGTSVVVNDVNVILAC